MTSTLTTKVICSALSFSFFFGSAGCTSSPQIVVDPRSISSEAKYHQDMAECHNLANSYSRGDATVGNAVVGASVGGGVVAGVATAVAGAVFAPAVPFIVGGVLLGGTIGGGLTKTGETTSREKILADCMIDRGYRAYSPN